MKTARFDSQEPPPMRRKHLSPWLLLLALVVLFSWGVHRTAAAQSTRMGACIGALVEDINPSLMSRTTATRKARGVCENLQSQERDFFRAITE
jgi:hypothetical protein